MTAVVDSSPLIVLGKVRRLDLLSVLYEEIAIPVAVVDEVLAKTQLVTPDLRQFVEHMRVRAVQSATLVQTLSVDLGRGEAEAIALAAEIGDALLVMDDADGRRVARAMGLRVTGVLGVLVEAKYRGVVPNVRPILDAMSNEGFWLSEALQRVVLDAVGE